MSHIFSALMTRTSIPPYMYDVHYDFHSSLDSIVVLNTVVTACTRKLRERSARPKRRNAVLAKKLGMARSRIAGFESSCSFFPYERAT